MHLGNAFSALLSYLSVKSKGGKWLLRIEDLDPGRSRYEHARMVEDDLLWLGLEWDEGGIDGRSEAQPASISYCQSRRGEIYEDYFRRLLAMELVYPCYCSRADLLAAGAPHQSDGRVIYPGTCRPSRMGGSFDGTVADGRRPSWRICVPDLDVETHDLHYGPTRINLARDCGDFIIRRADGGASYQLAVVVDDALMGVTEVVRGSDLLLSAPQQAWLHGILGFKAPEFAHLPLLCASDGRRLCKRDADLDMGALRRNCSPEQIIGRLAYLAGLQPTEEPCSPDDLVSVFSWDRVPLDDILL